MKTFVLAVLLSAVPTVAADIYTFDLLPADGNIAGLPGPRHVPAAPARRCRPPSSC